MELIFDTNVLVSGLLHPDRPIAKLALSIGRGVLIPVFDQRILDEYVRVLNSSRFAGKFAEGEASALRERIETLGIDAGPVPRLAGPLPHENDRAFVEVALATGAPIITGNSRHFPSELGIEALLPAEMVRRLEL
jgi:predicted nucleic acid-binding protein